MKALVLNRIALVLSCVGIYVSGVLSLGHLLNASIPCGDSHGCDIVARHPTSNMLFNLPNAYFGLLAYVIIAALAAYRLVTPGEHRKSLIVSYTVTAIGTLASIYLTYLSYTVIHATCNWCLASLGVMVLLLVLHAFTMQDESERIRAPRFDKVFIPVVLLLSTVALGMRYMELNNAAHKRLVVRETVPVEQILPKDAHIYGDPKAKVTIVEFGDLVCPSCAKSFPKLQEYVNLNTGKVNLAYRHFPMVGLPGHDQALPAAMIAEVAHESGMFWTFVAAMYGKEEKDLQSTDAILDIAASIGMNPDKTLARIQDKNDPAFKRGLRDISAGRALGVVGTPTYFIVAEGIPPLNTTITDLMEDLRRPEYQRLMNGG